MRSGLQRASPPQRASCSRSPQRPTSTIKPRSDGCPEATSSSARFQKKPNRKASEDRGVPTPRKRSSARCETTKHHTTGGRRFSFCPLLPSAGSSTPEGAPPTGVQSNVRGPRLGNRNPERPVSVLPATANVAYRAGWHCKQATNASELVGKQNKKEAKKERSKTLPASGPPNTPTNTASGSEE